MKRILQATVGGLLLTGLLAAPAAAQSLGEYARQQRAKKPATPAGVKEYTNDNLPTSGALSSVGQPSAAPASTGASSSTADADAGQDRSKQEAEWKNKFAAQRQVIATLEREIDVAGRENGSRQAQTQTTSQDLGSRLRNPVLWAAENKKYQDEIEGKKKELEAARQKLEDMKDDLRKAGLPGGWAE